MSKRWLSGFLIFALGFGCASLVTIATAQERSEEGELEEGLDYVKTESDVKLVNTGEQEYVVTVTRSPGIAPAEPPVSYRDGVIGVSTNGLARLRVYRLEPIAELADDFWRPCSMGDCPLKEPLPPPPPPIAPPDPSAVFLSPQ